VENDKCPNSVTAQALQKLWQKSWQGTPEEESL